MERGEIGGRLNGARAIRLQQVLRLVFELIEIRTDGQTNGMTSLLTCPGSAGSGEGGSQDEHTALANMQVDSVLPADGRRPATPFPV